MPAISFFGPPSDAPPLSETGVMSMPGLDPPAPDQLTTWALSGGHDSRVQFQQGEEGMSLVWSRFEAGFPLPRHSHSADCLYYVVAGEARMGNRVIAAGEGFFVPAGAPYAYTAGPNGIEILEFRSVGRFDMQITESVARWDRIVDAVVEHKADWQQDAPTNA